MPCYSHLRRYLENYSLREVSKYGAFPGPYIPAFGLNTKRCRVSLHIQLECGKNTDQKKIRNLDTFHAVTLLHFSVRVKNLSISTNYLRKVFRHKSICIVSSCIYSLVFLTMMFSFFDMTFYLITDFFCKNKVHIMKFNQSVSQICSC